MWSHRTRKWLLYWKVYSARESEAGSNTAESIGFLRDSELAAERRVGRLRCHVFNVLTAALYVGVQFFLMSVIVGQSVDLCQREMWVLEVRFLKGSSRKCELNPARLQ